MPGQLRDGELGEVGPELAEMEARDLLVQRCESGSRVDHQHDHVILTDTGEVVEFCDPRIESIKKTIEEVFDIEINNHSLYFYGTRKKKEEATD